MFLFQHRRLVKLAAGNKYKNRVDQKVAYLENKAKNVFIEKTQDDIFVGDVLERATEISQVLKKKHSIRRRSKKNKKKNKGG